MRININIILYSILYIFSSRCKDFKKFKILFMLISLSRKGEVFLSAENKMFFVFYFLLFLPLVASAITRCIFQKFSFYKLHFIFCIISLIFFLVYICFFFQNSCPIAFDIVTSLIVFLISQTHFYISIIGILICILIPSSIIYICMAMPHEKDDTNIGGLFYSIIFFPIYFPLMICAVLLELCRKFIKWILKPCKKPIYWLLGFCKSCICLILAFYKKSICWFIKLCKKLVCWLQI